MKRNLKRNVSLLLVLVLIIATLSGCNTGKDKEGLSEQDLESTVTKPKISVVDSDGNIKNPEDDEGVEDVETIEDENSDDYLFDFKFSTDDIDLDNLILGDGVTLVDDDAEEVNDNNVGDIPLSSNKISNELLPVGSVVLLKDSTKKVMIIGQNQIEVGNNDVIYDYSACLYPGGYINANTYLFDNEQIDSVYHVGCEDETLKVNNVPDGLLPVGSVVLLKDSTKKVMIIGWCQLAVDDEDTIYDYSGCLFPEGYINANSTYLFDNSQIESVHHLGYEDGEQKELKEMAEGLLNMWRSAE